MRLLKPGDLVALQPEHNRVIVHAPHKMTVKHIAVMVKGELALCVGADRSCSMAVSVLLQDGCIGNVPTTMLKLVHRDVEMTIRQVLG